MTTLAAEALRNVNSDLKDQGYQLVVYDTYRPQITVDAFVEWARDDQDLLAKSRYYPTLTGSKIQLFEQGYIAAKSGHSRGSTVDLTMIKLGESVRPVEVKKRTLTDG